MTASPALFFNAPDGTVYATLIDGPVVGDLRISAVNAETGALFIETVTMVAVHRTPYVGGAGWEGYFQFTRTGGRLPRPATRSALLEAVVRVADQVRQHPDLLAGLPVR